MKARTIYSKIEFWIVTITGAAFLLALLVMSKDAESHDYYRFTEYQIQYDFYKHLFIPGLAQIIIYYCGYIVLTKLIDDKKNNWAKAGSVFGLFLIIATLIAITNTYMDGWTFGKFLTNEAVYNDVFVESFTTLAIVLILFIAYYIIKELILNAIERSNFSKKKKERALNIFLALAFWIWMLIILGGNRSEAGVAMIGIVLPCIAFLVWIHLRYLIPLAGNNHYKSFAYIIRILPILFLSILFVGFTTNALSGSDDFAGTFVVIYLIIMIIVIGLIWYITIKQKEKGTLQTALGSSQANISFLRSQINPHFLFNALNTLYGTALQENAERTGEGIQKLGDMMRFMLHENMQDKIALAREVDYLNNYISLQKLRTATSPNIMIQTNIEEQLSRLDISPMLLIPFVENAFKHGISLQQSSFINISLHTKENVLYFDVNNSVHIKGEYDPEKMKSGIGLQNVKQRLALLYPKKHELIIRESAKEFFVHLTIQL